MPNRRFAPLALVIFFAACRSAPPFQGMEAAELHALAETRFEEGAYQDAEDALNRVLSNFPTYERTDDVRLLLARTHFEDGEYITAASEYNRFVERFASHPEAPQAALGACRSYGELSPDIQRDQSYTEQALVNCRNVVADYQGTPAAEEAGRIAEEMRLKLARKLYEIGDYYFHRDFYDSSIIYWEMVENQYGDTEWAPKALMGILKAYEEIGYDDLVEETRQRILEAYPGSDEARELADGEATVAAGGQP